MSWLAEHDQLECCYLTTTGRRTEQRHEIEIWFGVVDDTMYLVSSNGGRADWFRNLQVDPVLTVRIDDERRQGRARVVEDPHERQRVGDVMGAKYVWDGDESVGVTYESRCYDAPAVAIEFPAETAR